MKGIHKLENMVSSLSRPRERQPVAAPKKRLYEEKVKVLIARYYYYQFIGRKRTYEDILESLEKEFHISSRHIADVIEKQLSAIQSMKKQKPGLEWFRNNWAYLNW